MKYYCKKRIKIPNHQQQSVRVMKILMTYLFIFVFSINASAYSQQVISVDLDNTSLHNVFKTIEQNSDYIFIFRDNVKQDILANTSVKISSSSIEEIMNLVLKNTKIKHQIFDKQIVLYKEVAERKPFAAISRGIDEVLQTNITVTGQVRSQNGEPVIGATIRLVGSTTVGTATDVNGNFRLPNIPGNGVLSISSIGYETLEYPIQGRNNLSIELIEEATTLEDIVVVGYGSARRGDLTAAQTTVSAEAIEKTINTTIDQALQGRAAGVMVTTNSAQPGGGISVNIRGVSSLSGTTEPLYVIDGIQIQPQLTGYNNSSSLNPLAQLNPADIESMEILQGPSATAIYGSRATNGVVLITTKRGKSGETRIQYDFQYSLQDRPREIPVLDLKEYTIMNNELRRYLQSPIPEMQQDSSILGPGTNWQKEIFRIAPLTKHQISFSGGNDRTTFYLSAERFDQGGVVVGSGFDRTGLRLNLDNKAKDWLHFGLNLNASQTNDKLNTTITQAVRYAFTLPPYIAPRNPDGSYGGYPADQIQYHNEDLNPLARAELETHTSKRNNIGGGFNISLFIMKGLQFRTSINSSLGNSNNTDFIPTYTIGAISKSKAEMNEAMSETFYWNWNQLLEYKTKINNAHDITIMASHEAQESTWKGLSGYRTGFPVNEMPGNHLPSIGLGDPIGQRTGGFKGWWAQESYLARLNYNFLDRYLFTFTYRADGSVNFGKDKRWGYFPSGSFAWRVTQEPFFSKFTDVVNDLKIRYETGLTGNQGSGAGVFGPLRPVPSPWGNGFLLNQYGNPNLQWEETLTHNVGFNLSLFNSRITIDGDYYVRKTDNLLMPNPLPFYMGTSGAGAINPPIVNIGALSNRGWTFTLNTVNIHNRDFNWSTNFNISHNKSKIDRFYQETAVVDMTNWGAGGGFIQRSAVGQEAWQFWGYKSDGIFKTLEEVQAGPIPQRGTEETTLEVGYNGVWIGDYRYVDTDGNGRISPQDMTYIGNPYPKFTFGITNDVTWKDFTLSVLMIGSYGNKIYNAFRYSFLNPGSVYTYGNALRESYLGYARIGYDDSGNPYLLNPDATVARYGGGNGNWSRASDRFIEDGSYLRIKNVSLAYQLPRSLINKIRYIENVRVTLGVQNLYTLTNYSGFDPEIGVDIGHQSEPSRRTFGVDVGQYPQVRSYNLNVGVTF